MMEDIKFIELCEIEKKYYELIMAVGNKFPNETRHQTALKYIKNAEIGTNATSAEKG